MIIPCKTLMNFHYWLMNEARKLQGVREESDEVLITQLLYSGQQSIPAIPGACVKNNKEYLPVLVINDTELDYLNIIHTYLDAAKQANKEGLGIQCWIGKHGYDAIQFYEPPGFLPFSNGERPVPVDLTFAIHRIVIDHQTDELAFDLNLGK